MLSELKKRKLTKLFTMYDAGNLGVLKLSDFERIARILAELRGDQPDSQAYETLLEKYTYRWIRMRGQIKAKLPLHTLQNQGQITLDEWLLYHEQSLNDRKYEEEIEELAGLIFEIVDLDESGHLDRQEWKKLFQVYNIPVVYADEIFTCLDSNQNGFLSREEVIPLLKEFYLSDDPNAPGNKMFGPY